MPARLRPHFVAEQLQTAAPVSAAFGATTRAAMAIITELNHQIAELEAALAQHFETHPDADIYLSLPGLGVVLSARCSVSSGTTRIATPTPSLAEVRRHFTIDGCLRQQRAVLARHVRNRRLYDAIYRWAFCALSTSPGARAYYDQRRAAGNTHHQALRALGNRLVGIFDGCLAVTNTTMKTPLGTPHSGRELTTYDRGMSRTVRSCSSAARAGGTAQHATYDA